MRSLTAICLLVLFLFNLAGYRLLFFYLDTRTDSRYEKIIDREEYDESQLITMKIDINVPYQTELSGFERIDGEITVDGKVYKYVKRRIVNGQLILLCLPNEEKSKLQRAENDFLEWSNNVSDKQDTKHSFPKSSVAKNILSEFDDQVPPRFDIESVPSRSKQVLMNESLPNFLWVNNPVHPPDASLIS